MAEGPWSARRVTARCQHLTGEGGGGLPLTVRSNGGLGKGAVGYFGQQEGPC